MKLYLHNFLQDNIESTPHFPLKIVPRQVEEVEVEFNPDLIESFVRRIDLMALASACADLKIEFEPPTDVQTMDEDKKRELHHLLFEIEVVAGELVSPSGRHFPIVSGIPDMCPHVGAPEPEQPPQEEQAEE